MSKFNSIFFIIFFQSFSSFCQDDLHYKSKWQIKPTYGFNFPLSSLLSGEVTDNLIEYDDKANYLQLISVSYFFKKHWGVEFNYQKNNSKNTSKRIDSFLSLTKAEYESNYFVTPSTGASYGEKGNIERGYFGVIYRIENKYFCIYPKLSIGVTSFYTDWGTAYLKEKNTNRVILIDYSSGKRPNDHLTFATSASFGLKLSKRIALNIDVLSSYYKTNIKFLKTTNDLFNGQKSISDFTYKRNIFNLSIGTGLIITLK
jgi:hypothetical protein